MKNSAQCLTFIFLKGTKWNISALYYTDKNNLQVLNMPVWNIFFLLQKTIIVKVQFTEKINLTTWNVP